MTGAILLLLWSAGCATIGFLLGIGIAFMAVSRVVNSDYIRKDSVPFDPKISKESVTDTIPNIPNTSPKSRFDKINEELNKK